MTISASTSKAPPLPATTTIAGIVKQAATDADLAAQTATSAGGGVSTISTTAVATTASVDAALAAIVNDLNDLKAKLRTAGVLQT